MSDLIPNKADQASAILDSVKFDFVSIIEIFLILIFCIICWVLLKKVKRNFIKSVESKKHSGKISGTSSHVLMTLIPAGESFMHFSVLALGTIWCLHVLDISVSPLFYIISVFSVGISFGAKDVFTDIIRGVMTLIEGKIALGNFVTINGSSGYVKSLTVRKIELQYQDGSIELFPFSQVRTIRNFSLEKSVTRSTFQLSPNFNIDEFSLLASETLEELKSDENFKKFFYNKTPEKIEPKIINIKNEGIEVIVSIPINTDPTKIFEKEFNKIMLKKLQKTSMLS